MQACHVILLEHTHTDPQTHTHTGKSGFDLHGDVNGACGFNVERESCGV